MALFCFYITFSIVFFFFVMDENVNRNFVLIKKSTFDNVGVIIENLSIKRFVEI